MSGLSPERLELEITESVFLENSGMVLECLQAWKRLGVRIALDDSGTGYSNLACLSRLPIDRLKIDRSLIQGVRIDSREAAIVRTVVGLGSDLGFTVIAEGVETEDQLRLVQELGCHRRRLAFSCHRRNRPRPARSWTANGGSMRGAGSSTWRRSRRRCDA